MPGNAGKQRMQASSACEQMEASNTCATMSYATMSKSPAPCEGLREWGKDLGSLVFEAEVALIH
jgi:hypothetical protein